MEGDKALFGIIVVNRDGAAGVEAVEQAAYRHLVRPMNAQPSQSWYLGSAAQAAQARWLLDVGLLGITALAAADALGAAGVFLEQSQALGPLAFYQTGRRFYRRIALYNLALPVGAAAAAAAALLGGLMSNLGKGGWMSAGLLGAGLTAVAVSGVAVACPCGRTAAAHAASWAPRADWGVTRPGSALCSRAAFGFRAPFHIGSQAVCTLWNDEPDSASPKVPADRPG